MNTSESRIVDKAFSLLLTEFSDKKYGEFVQQEISGFLNGEKTSVSFMSEADEVSFNIAGDCCTVEYDFWNEEVGEFVKGSGTLGASEAVARILAAARANG